MCRGRPVRSGVAMRAAAAQWQRQAAQLGAWAILGSQLVVPGQEARAEICFLAEATAADEARLRITSAACS